MIFEPTPLPDLWHLRLERRSDERGSFARTFCRDEFIAHGLNPDVVQANLSFNHRAGTLRGLHLQGAPRQEDKLVRCVAGAVWDVALDLRPDSPTFLRHHAVELSAEAGNQIFIPAGMAHGFITLTDGAELFYQMSRSFSPEHARGYRYDDPAFAIPWPRPVAVISRRDLDLPAWDGPVPAR